MSDERTNAAHAAPRERPDFTVRQKILMAAVSLAQSGATFAPGDLVVRVWELFPESFALAGYETRHPDSNRVLAKLAGPDGLCGLGWLEHVDQRIYRVTRKGRGVAEQLAALEAGVASPREEEAEAAAPPRAAAHAAKPAKVAAAGSRRAAPKAPVAPFGEVERHRLTMIARGDALRKFLRGSPLTFADACAFWSIRRAMDPEVVRERLDATASLLARAVKAFAGDAPDPRMPTLATCYGLFNVDRLMRERFARELAALVAAPGARGGGRG